MGGGAINSENISTPEDSVRTWRMSELTRETTVKLSRETNSQSGAKGDRDEWKNAVKSFSLELASTVGKTILFLHHGLI